MTLATALAVQGIHLKSYAEAEHRTTCPRCSSGRKKKTDPCLATKVDNDGGAAWTCHHCGWAGNVPGDTARRERERSGDIERRKREPSPRPAPVAPAVDPEKPESMYDCVRRQII